MSTPERTSSTSSDRESAENARKRVCKACDRCRLKKSKCDGSNPCSRCKADNAICVFGERKKSHDKVYPKGYVEMLEQQQAQLVTGLRELYRRLQAGEEWPGERLKEYHGGHPLTHDILERLDLLHPSSDAPIKHEGFDEDLVQLQRRCMRENVPSPSRRRRRSPSEESEPGLTSSESSHGMSSPAQSMSFVDFSQKNSPQTPSLDSPFLQPSRTYRPNKSQQYAMPSMGQPTSAIDPMQLLEAQQQWIGPQQTSLEQMDMDSFSYNATPITYDPQVFSSFPAQAPDSAFWAETFNDFIQPNAMLHT